MNGKGQLIAYADDVSLFGENINNTKHETLLDASREVF